MAREIDTDLARLLANLMSGISEDCWCAGWMGGLEDALWKMVCGGSRVYGMGEVPEWQINGLRKLAERAGCWVVFELEHGRKFVPLDEWKALKGDHGG